MKSVHFIPLIAERKGWGSCLCSIVPATALLSIIYLLGFSNVETENRETWGLADILQSSNVGNCKNQCKPPGTAPLPEGIIENTSNLEMRPLWGFPEKDNTSTSLFAVAVGIKQKDLVDKVVKMFLSSDFVVMLFHYDGIVDEWKHFEWCDKVIHVSARNQTKWWFAKRFLHPDIVSEYSYIFLWDEDLGVEHFHPKVYVSIIEHEGLEISQPALDRSKSEVHHQITARESKSIVHRTAFKPGANGKHCDAHSKGPPCTGWIEMMAPVFSRAAWRCVWYMIQNDLIHAWGIDMQVGYCAQGDRTKNIGIVDAEYVVHHNRPTLGGIGAKNRSTAGGRRLDKGDRIKGIVVNDAYILRHYVKAKKKKKPRRPQDPRVEVRRQSYVELYFFRQRWEKAAKNDKCWVDPYH
ncbi:hypothetical protein ES288_A08G267800v1 [Gossypium darwinii]|uniref:Uncharacterized protein n=1 Tax=Gossypium darwinii TaxID=34276 RepID=A0A5D2FRC9_GOSDA|nr:hypothetical protein ES288_A08G267800v1 [Gossypium darwinii]